MSLTSRERMAKALGHQSPDRVPVDIGGTFVSGMSASVVYRLRKALGLEDRPVKVIDPFQMLGEVDAELREYFGCDVYMPPGRGTIWGYPATDWKQWTMFDGTPVLVPGLFNTKLNADGSLYQYPEGDCSLSPSSKMPAGGFYFDAICRQPPLDEDNLNPADNLEEFGIATDEQMETIARDVDEAWRNTTYALTGGAGGTTLGDVAHVPGVFMRHPKGIREVEEWYVSVLTRQDYIREVFDKQTDIGVENLKRLYQAVGNKIQIFILCGTDFGSQSSLIFSPEVFRTVFLPYYRKITDWIHKNTGWKVYKHTCGAIEPLIPDFIEAGFDILQPVQCSAVGMDPATLKEKYGPQVVFWGAGIDTQKTLPFGTPEEVYREVSERIRIFNRNGGFVFGSIHNIQAGTPVENVMALRNAIRDSAG